MANIEGELPAGGRVVPYDPQNPFGGIISRFGGTKESEYESFRTPTSDGSGEEFFFRPDGKGDDLHPDPFRYTREVSYTPLYKNNPFPFGAKQPLTIGNSSPFGSFRKDAATQLFTRNVTFTKAGKKEGIAFNDRVGAETPKRANDPKSDGSRTGLGSGNKKTKNNRSTILTGSKGLLGGGGSSSKTVLGA